MSQPNDLPADMLLKRYETEIDLYKFYLDIAVKGSLFAFGLTGALLSYYFTNYEENKLLVWSLLLPIILNAGFCVLFFFSIRRSKEMSEHHKRTCEQLGGLHNFNTDPLKALCQIFSGMYGLVAIGLVIVFWVHAV